MKLKPAQRNQVAKKVHRITSCFYEFIPLHLIDDILGEFNLTLIQEDNTKWSGVLCGETANTVFSLGIKDSENNGVYQTAQNKLYFYWYKHVTGRYETNAYLI